MAGWWCTRGRSMSQTASLTDVGPYVVMGLSFTGWEKPWSRHRVEDLARVSYRGRVGTASPITEPLGDQRVSSSIRGDEHERGSHSK